MARNLVSWFLIVVCAVVFCGFISGCQEEQVKEPVDKIETVPVAKPVVEKPVPVVEKPVPVVEKPVPVVEVKPALPRVAIVTDMGEIVIELDPQKAPITVKNFLWYVNDGFYDGLLVHRVVNKFMIQTGGFTPQLAEKATQLPIRNEAGNKLNNIRGTVAMARQKPPHTATSQFFINQKDNAFLNYGGPTQPGYAVFGKVVKGMDVVDAIAIVPTTTKRAKNGMMLENSPVKPVVVKSVKLIK